jgi:hypothetical protein
MTVETESTLTTWMPRIRWLIAELLVVITGILIALTLQAWWQGRGDLRTERNYLERLLLDTRENERLVDSRIASDSILRERSLRMSAILRDRLPLPPQDTLAALSRISSSGFSLVTATYDALVATGDIKLLRNPALRASTLALAGEVDRSTAMLTRNLESQGRWVDLRTTRMLYHVRPPGRNTQETADPLDILWWLRVDFAQLQEDPEAVRAFQLNVYTLNSSLAALRSLRRPLAEYGALLENELARAREE